VTDLSASALDHDTFEMTVPRRTAGSAVPPRDPCKLTSESGANGRDVQAGFKGARRSEMQQ
jgi:hypothetical protein